MDAEKPNLDSAYALETPADNRRLYADWATDYDAGFVADHDYQLHQHTARAYAEAGGQGPVLDVGAGTGLCGQVLAELGMGPVDATDISAEMLDMAERKDVYRDLFEADLTEGLPVRPSSYSGVVSSGTFTHGHIGPDGLDELLRIARPGAQLAVSINAQHFNEQGFGDKLKQLNGRISDLKLPKVRIYGAGATGEHRDDTAIIALFQKA